MQELFFLQSHTYWIGYELKTLHLLFNTRERRNKEVVFSRCQGLQPSTAPCRTNYNITCPKMSRGHMRCACVGLLNYGGCRVTFVTCMSLKLHLSLITYLHTTVHTVLRITWHFPCLFLMHHYHCSIMTYISKCIYLNNPNLGLSDHCFRLTGKMSFYLCWIDSLCPHMYYSPCCLDVDGYCGILVIYLHTVCFLLWLRHLPYNTMHLQIDVSYK